MVFGRKHIRIFFFIISECIYLWIDVLSLFTVNAIIDMTRLKPTTSVIFLSICLVLFLFSCILSLVYFLYPLYPLLRNWLYLFFCFLVTSKSSINIFITCHQTVDHFIYCIKVTQEDISNSLVSFMLLS